MQHEFLGKFVSRGVINDILLKVKGGFSNLGALLPYVLNYLF